MKKKLGVLSSVLLVGSLLAGQGALAVEGNFNVKSSKGIQLNADFDEGFNYAAEPNNSFVSANVILQDDFILGTFDLDDTDYFKITVDGDEPIYFNAVAGPMEEYTDMSVTMDLYDASKMKLDPDEVYNYEGYYDLSKEVAPGTYYFSG